MMDLPNPRTAYAELACASNFSFLRGASHPKELVATAVMLGHRGMGIADRNTVAGVVRAWAALRILREEGVPPPDKERQGGSPGEYGYQPSDLEHPDNEEVMRRAAAFKLVVGARLGFIDGTPDIIAYPETRKGWGRLCRLLTIGNQRAKKGGCHLTFSDLLADPSELLLIVIPPPSIGGLEVSLNCLAREAPGAVWLGAAMLRQGDDRRRLARLSHLAQNADVPMIATNDVLYHDPRRRPLQDVLTCIREKTTIEKAGCRLEVNSDRHLKDADEMARLFRDNPEAIRETTDLLERVAFDRKHIEYRYTEEPVPPGKTPQQWLEELTWRCAEIRYPKGVSQKVANLLAKELAFIGEQGFAAYFLTIRDIVQFAEENRILCQGRGSAANSAVCYVLGITAVDPSVHDVLFERFLSSDRGEPPDIDVDFEHERREEVIQYIYRRYGRHRAGIAATVIHYRPRSAIREVGKVMGLTADVTDRLAGSQWGSYGQNIPDVHVEQGGMDAGNPTLKQAVGLANALVKFPRHLSQHVGGFVLTQDRLDETVPIGNAAMKDRTFIEWDKDDIDEMRLMKVDVLALGMLTCIRKAFDLIRDHEKKDYALHTVPAEQADVYAMLQKGDSIGVFQVESRAQINMLPRLKPERFYDLVIQVAIVRPGPIQGDMVHPYLRRRAGVEPVTYAAPHPDFGPPDELVSVLEKTLGVPLFQEQAMRVAIEAAKFSPKDANGLRKSMGTFRGDGDVAKYENKFVGNMIKRGYDPAFAQRCFDQIKGFGSYGFPESHATSFAKLVYISSYIKCRHPAAFACALLNSQPMGFYAPAQIVRDAQEHGVEARAIDVNISGWDNTLEESANGPALRLGLRQIDGFREDWADDIADARASGAFTSVEDVLRRARLPTAALRKLADADALRSLGLDRREGLWAVRRLPSGDALPLFEAARARELAEEADARLPVMPLGEHVAADYQTTRLSLKAHPMAILRPVFEAEGVLSCAELGRKRGGSFVRLAGVVLVRQRPGNGHAIFVTLEDETGVANALLWARDFERFRRETMSARLMLVEGRVERSPEGVTHIMTSRVIDRTPELSRLSEDHQTEIQLARADVVAHPQQPRTPPHRHPRDVRILPGSRDFH